MLKLLGTIIKVSMFAAVVLLLGNWIRFGGRTVSDQVRIKMAHAERTPIVGAVRGWTESLKMPSLSGESAAAEKSSVPRVRDEEIGATERQKLKALIRELNSARR